MQTCTRSTIKRGIALFGGNFILPFENQNHLSNTLSKKYLNFCQQFNQSSKDKQTIQTGLLETQNNYEFLVLAPRGDSEGVENDGRRFYDIATIVSLQTCSETGAIKALSKGVDSLVRIKKNTHSSAKDLIPQYTKEGRLIVENNPLERLNSIVRPIELHFEVYQQRKLFFCDYEMLHNQIPQYSDTLKVQFIVSIKEIASKINCDSLASTEKLEQLAADSSMMFPRLQLLELLKHFDDKFYFGRRHNDWLDTKYNILQTKDDQTILNTLLSLSALLV